MTRVRDCMTKNVLTLDAGKRLIVVQEMMSWAHIRHIPVIEKGRRVVGIVSHRDLLHAAMSSAAVAPTVERRHYLGTIPLATVMRTDVQTIGPDASIQEAAVKMRESKIGCLPVVDGGKLVGIISEYDLLGVVAGMPDLAVAPT